MNYRLTHPEASVVTRRLESDEGTPADIAQSIRMLDSSVDIYFTRTNFTGYQAMLEKGFSLTCLVKLSLAARSTIWRIA